ncbi:MAG: hypothetical protein RLZZ01_2203 [Actinomycetota bacterium]
MERRRDASVNPVKTTAAGKVTIAIDAPTPSHVPARVPTTTGVVSDATRVPAVIRPRPAPRRPGNRAASSYNSGRKVATPAPTSANAPTATHDTSANDATSRPTAAVDTEARCSTWRPNLARIQSPPKRTATIPTMNATNAVLATAADASRSSASRNDAQSPPVNSTTTADIAATTSTTTEVGTAAAPDTSVVTTDGDASPCPCSSARANPTDSEARSATDTTATTTR